ncbi:MAG TPA: YMGG-like glycine zipper-containing protein [Thermoanaerobaculia bacterium]|nr:YMGG-like glycine zipper-containing protein [Thermoanaerobaculia bacterium]
MLNKGRQRVSIALFLMAFLVFGSVSAYAGSTHGSDRLVKGAAIGAAAGAVTQMVRGRTTGKELLKGAAVGASVGAAAGAYSDYKQEKKARERAERRNDYRYDNYYGGTRYRGDSRPAYRWDRDASYARSNNGRGGHRHSARCNHRR